MTKQKNDSHNFWSGYAMGMLSGSLIMFAFATKKGRDTLKKIMDHTDTLEHNIEDILSLIQQTAAQNADDDKKSDS